MRSPRKIFTTIYGNEIWTNVKMKRLPIVPAAGGGPHFPLAQKSIRFARYGCANRPFFHINVAMTRRHQHDRPIEQLGTYDPLPNEYNERLCSINIERFRYWMAHRTSVSASVAQLLGLAGILPVHPRTYMRAWRVRKRELKALEEPQTEDKEKQELSA